MIRHRYTFCRNLLSKKRVERELEEELRSYVELVAHEKVRCGTDAEKAWREARRDLGNVEQVKESIRDIRKGVYVDTFIPAEKARNPPFETVSIQRLEV